MYLALQDRASILIYCLLYVPCFLLSVSSLFMCFLTDPGAVPMGARPLPEEEDVSGRRKNPIRRCPKCNDNFKPPRAHHDSVTGRCIVKLDHFCPWVCNAVGALNHKFFLLFILYAFCCSFVALVIVSVRLAQCGARPRDEEGSMCHSFHSLPVFMLFVASVIFFLFTACMLAEQVDPVTSNTSKIAKMKIRAGQASLHDFCNVNVHTHEFFGGKDSALAWHWFLPTKLAFPEGVRDKVLGYSWQNGSDRPWEEEDGSLDSCDETHHSFIQPQPASVGSAAVGILHDIIHPNNAAKPKYSLLVEDQTDIHHNITTPLDGISMTDTVLKND